MSAIDSIMGRLYNLVGYRRISSASSNGQNDRVEGPPARVGEKPRAEGARRMYPWGMDSRHPEGCESVTVSPLGGSQSFIIGADHPTAAPDHADANWTMILHNEVAGTWVKLRKDGGVQVEGKGARIEITKDGDITIVPATGKTIRLGDAADVNLDTVVLYSEMKANYDEFVGKYNGHSHAGNGVAPAAPMLAATLSNVGSSNVKAKI